VCFIAGPEFMDVKEQIFQQQGISAWCNQILAYMLSYRLS